ncbi:hypothetical protein M513_13633 [Trichuris suis]|uniref:WD domain, G-beta repeat protein n=1 Tax=Trichuris suis TaxID=68888 RepID=A0A085LKJ8_9BILA|nr:hypothetical protein M513_13633 [Trichuris suis]
MRPIGCISNCHSAALTDVSFSDDGRFLVTSLIDGYLSFISFSQKINWVFRWTQPVGLPPKRCRKKEQNVASCTAPCKSIDKSADADPSWSAVITSDSSTDNENGFSEVNPSQTKRPAGVNNVHSQGVASEIQIVERSGDSISREQHGVDRSCFKNVKVRGISLQPVEGM